jgi:hypothetical protein
VSTAAARAKRRNGQPAAGETVTLPRELVQAMIDAISTMPAGQVYPLLRALDAELGLGSASAQQQPEVPTS